MKKVPLRRLLVHDERGVVVEPAASYPSVGVLNRGRGLFRKPAVKGAETSYRTIYPLKAGQVVYSKLFAWEGSVAVVDADSAGSFVSSEFPHFDVDPAAVEPTYLRHVLAADFFIDMLSRSTTGMGQRRQRVNVDAFLSVAVPLPGIDEQRTIAARLDAVASGEAIITGACTPRPEPLRWLSTLLDECFRRAALPQVRADSLFTTVSDIVQPTEDPAPATRFVGLEHLERDSGIRISSGPISPRSGRKFRFLAGDVLYGYLRPYLNKVWAADGPGLCSVEQYVLRPLEGVMPNLLSQSLRCSSTLQAVNDATHRLQLPRIRTALLGAIEVPDVRRVRPELRCRLNAVEGAAVRLNQLYARQTELRASLLTAARNEVFSKLA